MNALQGKTDPHLAQEAKLLRILGVGFGVAVVIGGTIGVGILRTPGVIAAQLGTPWLIILVWAFGGVYSLLGANYTAELATMLPKAGGPYVYAHRAYGDYVGFVVGWSNWLGNTAALAFLPIAFAEYAVALVPSLAGCVTVIAILIVLLLSLLNWVGLRLGSWMQKLMSLLKAIAFLAFIAVCFAFSPQSGPTVSELAPPAAPATFSALLVVLVLSFQLVLGTYEGWHAVVYFAEEDENPARNIPLSLIGGVLLIIGIYLLVNLALLYVLPVSQLAASKLPVADAMQQIFGVWSSQIVTILALLSLLAIINACIMFTPRTLYALGRDGLFSSKGVILNAGGTPVVALMVTVLVAILLIATGTFETLMAIHVFFAVVKNNILIGSLFTLRRREPELPRPFKTWGYPYAPLILLLIGIVIFIGFVMGDITNSLYALVTLAASSLIYLLIKKKRRASPVILG